MNPEKIFSSLARARGPKMVLTKKLICLHFEVARKSRFCQKKIFLLHLNEWWIKNDGLQKHYERIMKQNNWYRMMGISNAFSLSVASHRIYFGHLFQSCLVFMWRNKNPLFFFFRCISLSLGLFISTKKKRLRNEIPVVALQAEQFHRKHWLAGLCGQRA